MLVWAADEFLREVIPAVEKTYRVKTGRENRALAGLSMGGGQTLRVLVTHPDEFAYVGIWSAGIFGVDLPAVAGADARRECHPVPTDWAEIATEVTDVDFGYEVIRAFRLGTPVRSR